MPRTSNAKKDIDEKNNVVLFPADSFGADKESVVYHNGKILFRGFRYSKEYLPDDKNLKYLIDINKCRFFESHEGTVIMVFKAGSWYTSTMRKLDAFKSKWASKTTTFGQNFASAIRQLIGDDDFEDELSIQFDKDYLSDLFEKCLNPDKTYMFLLKPSANERIVCRAEPIPTIYHIGTITHGSSAFSLDDTVQFNTIKVEKPKELFFDTFHNLTCSITNIDIAFHQGIIILQNDNEKLKRFKVLNNEYYMMKKLRNNNPNKKLRYIELINNPKMRLQFEKLYGFEEEAQHIENEIIALANTILTDENPPSDLTETIENIFTLFYHLSKEMTQTNVVNYLKELDPKQLNKYLNIINKANKTIN